MKTIITFLIGVIICLSACSEGKKNKLDGNASQENNQISVESKSQLLSILDNFNQALIDPNAKELNIITDDKLTYGHSSGLIQNKSEFIDDVIHGGFDFVTINAEDQAITYGENLAIVRHDFLAKAINKGEPIDVKIGVMLVWIYNEGQWKLIARQAHKLKD